MSAGHWTHHQELKIQITQIQRPGKSRCHIPVHIHIHLSAQKRNLVVIIVINSVSSMLTFVDILNMQRPMTERSVEEERRHAVGRDVSIEEIFTHLIKPSLITKRLYTHVNRCLEAIHHHAAEPKMQFSGLNDVCGGVMSASVSSGPRFFQRSSESLQVLHSQSSVFSTLKVPCDGDRWMYHPEEWRPGRTGPAQIFICTNAVYILQGPETQKLVWCECVL